MTVLKNVIFSKLNLIQVYAFVNQPQIKKDKDMQYEHSKFLKSGTLVLILLALTFKAICIYHLIHNSLVLCVFYKRMKLEKI